MMQNPCKYILSLAKVIWWKTRYMGKIEVQAIQAFEKIRLVICGKSKVKIGGFNQNREEFYISVQNAQLTIGNHCFFNINCSITCMNKIKIGDNCKFGNNVVIVDHNHNFMGGSEEFVGSEIIIGNNVWIGANCTILMGTHIEDNIVIAAGSVVKGYIPSNTLFYQKRENVFKSIQH